MHAREHGSLSELKLEGSSGCVALSHPEVEVSSPCLPGGRALALVRSGLEASVGEIGAGVVYLAVVVVDVLGAGVVGAELVVSGAVNGVFTVRGLAVTVLLRLGGGAASRGGRRDRGRDGGL